MGAIRHAESAVLVRAIGRWSLAALAINSVIGSGVFGLPATVAGLLGSYSAIAVLIASVAMGIIMACFAEVSSRFSDAGGPYLYARTAFGRLIGVLVAWLFYLALAAASAANVNLFIIYLAEFWTGVSDPSSRFLILTILITALAIINVLGVRQGTVANNIFTIVKIFALAIVILAGSAMILMRPTQVAPAVLHTSFRSWLRATVLLAFLFGGFESALAPMSEAKDPRRDAAFALFAALVGCSAIYALIQGVVTAVLGSAANTTRPLAEVARVAIGNRGGALVAISAMVSVYGLLGAKLLGMPRVTVALARRFTANLFYRKQQISHPLVLDFALCSSHLDIGQYRQLRLERNPLGYFSSVLLRSSVRGCGCIAKTRRACEIPATGGTSIFSAWDWSLYSAGDPGGLP